MRRLMPLVAAAIFATGVNAPASAQTFQTQNGPVKIVTVAKGFEYPWGLAFLPDGRMIVTERVGSVRLVSKDGKISPPLTGTPRVRASGQGGMLDVALHPDFAQNRRVYLSYSEPGSGGSGTAVGWGVLDGNALKNFRVIWRMTPKSSGGRHFGSRLVFAPDGTLFITIGDRGQRDRVQDTSINRGQVIRVNADDGSIPKDNPFVGRPGFRPDIWSLGHRNPQSAALNPATNKLWTVEHGARGGDEINIPEAGKNYGWPVISYGRHYFGGKIGEGTKKAGMEQPIYYWDPSIAPSGMAFYTGDKFPAWKGNLFVGALRGQALIRLTLNGDKVVREERLFTRLDERIRDVRQGPDGYLYMLTDSDDGRLLKVEPAK